MYLPLCGFDVWYLWLFIFTMYACLFDLFVDLYSISAYSSYIVNEIDGLLLSNKFGSSFIEKMHLFM